MKLTVLLVDDELMLMKTLKKAIEKVEGFEVIGESKDGYEAIEVFKRERPDIVFLDVEMKGLNGIECAKIILDLNPKTIIIFATAHSEYMIDAFELYAFDYLVKPFKLDRIYKTLERIRDLKEVDLPSLPKEINEEFKKLVIKNKSGVTFVDIKDIILVQREEGATVIYTKDSSYVTSEGLTDVENKLPEKLFFRSHKSYIINLSEISKIYPYGRWTYVVKLKNTTLDALLTHDRYEEIKRIFS